MIEPIQKSYFRKYCISYNKWYMILKRNSHMFLHYWSTDGSFHTTRWDVQVMVMTYGDGGCQLTHNHMAAKIPRHDNMWFVFVGLCQRLYTTMPKTLPKLKKRICKAFRNIDSDAAKCMERTGSHIGRMPCDKGPIKHL